jgi:hypothetical protein
MAIATDLRYQQERSHGHHVAMRFKVAEQPGDE